MSASDLVRATLLEREGWTRPEAWDTERISEWCTEDVEMLGAL